MKLSYTNVKTFRDCPKKYEFKYIQHLPEPEGEELQIGIAGHEVLEVYYKLPKYSRSQDAITEILERNPKNSETIRQRVKESLEGYHEWATVEDSKLEITEVEKSFNMNIEDYVLGGKIDGIGTFNGNPVILEHKFKGTWGTDVADQFQFDEQNKAYSYATGIRQVLYNLIRTKPAKTRPKFERVFIIVPEVEVERFKDDLIGWANKIDDARDWNSYPRNRGYGCKWCPFITECYGLQ